MNSEDFDSTYEIVSGEVNIEESELDSSSKEVVGIIAEDAKQLEAEGLYELEGLSEGLPENDPVVASAREHLLTIADRAKELTKWATASLALSMAQPAVAQEVSQQQEETEIVVTASAKPYKIERTNPQRDGYTTPEGYRKYIDTAWESFRAPHSLEQFSLDEQAASRYNRKFEELTEEERKEVEFWSTHYQNRTNVINQEVEATLDRTPFDDARSLSDKEIEKQSAEYQEAIQNLDDQREWLAGVVHSPEYKRRLLVNEKINKLTETEEDSYFENVYGEYVTKEEFTNNPPLERRKNRVTQDVLHVSDIRYPLTNEKNLGEWDGLEGLSGSAVIAKGEAVNPESTTGVHELEHHQTEAEKGISPAAKWLYGRAFNSDFITQEYPEHAEYFSRPEEIAAFKREFEYELEKLTDWKYGEPVTPKLLEQIQKLRDEEKFNEGGELFLQIIKPGYLMRIMNTLADNSPGHGVISESQVGKA